MRPPKVVVGMPTRGTAHVRSIVQAHAMARAQGTELLVEIGSPVQVVRRRLSERFLATDGTHLLTIDDDVIAPDGALERLLALDVPVAAAVYPLLLGTRFAASACLVGQDDFPPSVPAAVFQAGLIGLGFTLIRRDAFDGLRAPWFVFGVSEAGKPVGEDVWFSRRVRQAGHEILCDGSLVCSHMKGEIDLAQVVGWASVGAIADGVSGPPR